MIEPTEKETKWFVKRLIELRDKVDGYYESLNFELKDIKDWEAKSGLKLPQDELKNRVFHMLNEIKGHYIEDNNNTLFAESLKYQESGEGKITIEGYTTKMLMEYNNWLSLSREARLALNIKPIEKTLPIKFKTGGKNFELNINDGSLKFGDTEARFGTTSQEFKLLKCLVENRNNIVRYENIYPCLGLLYGVAKRNDTTTILKRVKYKMKILPKRRTSNPDIFINDPNSGYEILED